MASVAQRVSSRFTGVLSLGVSRGNKSRSYYTYSPEPAQPLPNREPKWTTALEAMQCIKSGDTVFIQGAAATPIELVKAMTEYGKTSGLKGVTVCHMHTEGNAGYTEADCDGIFRSLSFFMAKNVRKAVAEGRSDTIPIFLQDIPKLFHQKIIKPNVALIQVSPPDQHGYCSIGTSVDCVRAALIHSKLEEFYPHLCGKKSGKSFTKNHPQYTNRDSYSKLLIISSSVDCESDTLDNSTTETDPKKRYSTKFGFNPVFLYGITNAQKRLGSDCCFMTTAAQVNPQMPRTFGDSQIHQSHFDFAVKVDVPLPEHGGEPATEVEQKIGSQIAENLVDDGATLQLGIGSIPDAVLAALHDHKDLGIHSEMFAAGTIPLFKSGAITNNKKVIHQGKTIGSFLIGTRALYDFVDNNPSIEMKEVNYVNNTHIISQNPKMTAINSCIEVDLSGQVVADSIGTRMYSGFGGQVDFIRGSAEGFDGKGKPIIALPSTTNKGESKISPFIKQGAGVVTTRAHVHYIVTEYGIASLFGASLRQRAYALINIAHPKHREALEKAAFERLKVMPSP
uniref:Acetyl-CoA hydrolase n=1 Tax=Timema tahoe TaxID=61484 RepID=A0A7R9P0I1_9NEOP|nr:unnamed protein product [Timema tahoe]